MAETRKPRIALGDTGPAPALIAAVEEKDYYSARVPKSLISKLVQAQGRDGVKRRHEHFTLMVNEYLKKHHPDLI